MKQTEFTCVHGRICGVSWGWQENPQAPVIFALHGWLDNAATFELLGPVLADAGYRVVAIDLPGHGQSCWLADGGDYYIWEAATAIVQVLKQLDEPVHLLGHSMGAATALILAAVYPELVKTVVALDAMGPLSTPPAQAPQQLRKGIEDVIRRGQQGTRIKVYPSIEQALVARVGKDPLLSPDCIRPVVERNLQSAEGGFSWRTDPRLRHASKVRMTEDMVESYLSQISCQVLAIRAERGIIPKSMFDVRLAYLKDSQFDQLPGHHHFHLAQETVANVAQRLIGFYKDSV